MSKFDHPMWKEFDDFFSKHLSHNGLYLKGSCLERDVLRGSEDHMWQVWVKVHEEGGNIGDLGEWLKGNSILVDNLMTLLEVNVEIDKHKRENLSRQILTMVRAYFDPIVEL